MNQIYRLIKLELRQLFRDRQWLITTILVTAMSILVTQVLIPTLLPRIMNGTNRGEIVISGNTENRLVTELQRAGYQIKISNDAQKSVLDRQADLGLKIIKIPEVFGQESDLTLYVRPSNLKSTAALRGVEDVFRELNRRHISNYLKKPETQLNPYQAVKIASENPLETAAGIMIFALPIILIGSLSGESQTVGLEITASVKERGELEANLTTPFSRVNLVITKTLTTLTMILMFSVVVLIILLLVNFIREQVSSRSANETISLNFGKGSLFNIVNFTQISLIIISVGIFFSATTVAIGLGSKTHKAAKSLLEPFGLLVLLTGIAAQFADFIQRDLFLYAVPVVGSLLGLLDSFKGMLTFPQTGVIVITHLACAGIAFFVAQHLIQKETIL
jgi:sodium transport system permease protein